MAEKLIIPDIEEEEDKVSENNPADNSAASENITGDIGIDLDQPMNTGVETPANIPVNSSAPISDNKDIDKLQNTINKLELSVQNLEFEKKLQSMKEEMLEAVMEKIKPLQRELEDWKERKIPEPREFDTEGAYRENLFTIGCYVLEEILPELFEAVPEYSLIANTIGKNFEDGTVSDGIISINVSVKKDEYIHDFKVDVPILNGVALAPQYLSRGLKIIPLTRDAIQQELEYITFQKTNVTDLTDKQTIYSNEANNRYKRLDTQKQYQINNQQAQPVGVPSMPSGIPNIRKVEKIY